MFYSRLEARCPGGRQVACCASTAFVGHRPATAAVDHHATRHGTYRIATSDPTGKRTPTVNRNRGVITVTGGLIWTLETTLVSDVAGAGW